ncbi:hypothetical protein FACS189483_10300 [Spirochaetia bacterium]|nr:hypothetical protein FACS189483_10300 [Spirochaetia bacterium]
MKIVSWNCHCRFTKEKAEKIFHFEPKIDILVLQECQRKLAEDKDLVSFLKDKRPVDFRWYGQVQETKEGVGVFIFNDGYKFKTFPECYPEYRNEYQFVLPFKFEGKNDFDIFVIWTKGKDSNYQYCQHIVQAVKHYRINDKKQTILIGDFNSFIKARVDDDKYHAELDNVLLKSGAFYNCAEKKDIDKQHTYFPNFSKEKSGIDDFCYASSDLQFIDMKIGEYQDWVKLEPKSDHCPISVDFDL